MNTLSLQTTEEDNCNSEMSLRSIILSVKNPALTADFLTSVLGLVVRHESASMVELCGPSARATQPPIVIKEANVAASLSTGYTPILNFDVNSMEGAVAAAMERGGMLDGAIKYKSFGKVAALRSPDGHMLGLFEPAIAEESPDN